MLATVRPRDIAGRTRRRSGAEALADLVAVDKKLKKIKAELKAAVAARGSTQMEVPGIDPPGRLASSPTSATSPGSPTATASPLDRHRTPGCLLRRQIRHRLSRAGNRRMNHVIHIAAIVQLRHDTEGRAYYRRKLAAGKPPLEALRCLKRRLSDVIYRRLVADARTAHKRAPEAGPEGTAGRLKNPARSTCPRTSTLRISHFRTRNTDATPDSRTRKRPGQAALEPAS